jgi:ABC-type lipoprotein export system ATPase subunit
MALSEVLTINQGDFVSIMDLREAETTLLNIVGLLDKQAQGLSVTQPVIGLKRERKIESKKRKYG